MWPIITLSWHSLVCKTCFLLPSFSSRCPSTTWDPNNFLLPPLHLAFLPSFTLSAPRPPARYVSAESVCLLLETPPVSRLVQTPGRTGWINNNLLQLVISWRRKKGREEGKVGERVREHNKWKEERRGLEGGIIEGGEKVEGRWESAGRNGNMSQVREYYKEESGILKKWGRNVKKGKREDKRR